MKNAGQPSLLYVTVLKNQGRFQTDSQPWAAKNVSKE